VRDTIPMNTDKAPVNFDCFRNLKGGDTDRGGVEHISASLVSINAQSEKNRF
jgi:hypothetical protein